MKEQILRLHAKGYSYNRIKEELGCSKGTIAYHLGVGQKEKTRIRSKRWKAFKRAQRKNDQGQQLQKQSSIIHG